MCKIEGCPNSAFGRGLCAKHYFRQRRHGDAAVTLKPGPKQSKPASEPKVEVVNAKEIASLRKQLGPMSKVKTRENLARRQLDRMGYRLVKSRARDPRDLTFGGYQIKNLQTAGVDAGWGNLNRGFAFSLEDVEAWIAKQ